MFPDHRQSELPEPSAQAIAHSEQLRERILVAIDANGGALSFSHFMQMALYEPGFGYYAAGSEKFGAAGDFVTAPDFGDFLARAIVATLAPGLAACAEPVVLELGAGTGRLASDILRLLDRAGLTQVRYRILEPSPDLRERQANTLGAALCGSGRVEWLEALEPGSITGAIVANEVADALPVDRIRRIDGEWQQLAVTREGHRFRWCVRPLTAAQRAQVDAIDAALEEPLPDGYSTEIRPLLGGWMESLCNALADGDLLLIDYGMSRREYFHPQRADGTLMCHYRHRAHADPFLHPGLQDLTAWVDFSDCAAAGQNAGCTLAGYTTQGSWIAAALADDPGLAAELDIAAAAKLRTLLLPGEMGERFKALLLSRPSGGAGVSLLPGRDMRARLQIDDA